MQPMQWNIQQIKQCERETGLPLIVDKDALEEVNQDFGRLRKGQAAVLFKALDIDGLQKILSYASRNKLPVTIRANGLSQSGQSLSCTAGLCLDISQLNSEVRFEGNSIVAGCSLSFRSLMTKSLERKALPWVYPYNCNLNIGGVLSVGGLGSASFKEGIIASHVSKLRVITAEGRLLDCSAEQNADLFHACLSGAGLFGIIYEAHLDLRRAQSRVLVQDLCYQDPDRWIGDQFILQSHCDYLESALQVQADGSKSYHISLAIEYEDKLPQLEFIQKLSHVSKSKPVYLDLLDYLYRHDPRLKRLEETSAWMSSHPWYECYVDSHSLQKNLPAICEILDGSLGGLYHVFPVAPKKPRYFMLPKQANILTFNILPPLIHEQQKGQAIHSLLKLDKLLFSLGGKRYISGWFDESLDSTYWRAHYAEYWEERRLTKLKYDPDGIFVSKLFPSLN